MAFDTQNTSLAIEGRDSSTVLRDSIVGQIAAAVVAQAMIDLRGVTNRTSPTSRQIGVAVDAAQWVRCGDAERLCYAYDATSAPSRVAEMEALADKVLSRVKGMAASMRCARMALRRLPLAA
ncbi:hypothetical protein AB7849_09300 [Rhodanobacter sp. 115]|uniref:hypothetical protein n=1 Tax=Rhodanobacter sp. FW021-MT20 TaxID=1162282 RepID=UPI0034E508DA